MRGAVRCAYLARMVEHDEARHDPHHKEAHIARLVACERRHGTGLGDVSRRPRRAAVARGGSRGLFYMATLQLECLFPRSAVRQRLTPGLGGDLPT